MQVLMWTEEETEALGRMYSDLRISREEMEECFERPWQVIRVKARRLGLSRLRISRNRINHDYFRNITMSEQAYWLGWLASDGHVAISSKLSLAAARQWSG